VEVDPAALPARALAVAAARLGRLLASLEHAQRPGRPVEQRLAVAADREVAQAVGQPLLLLRLQVVDLERAARPRPVVAPAPALDRERGVQHLALDAGDRAVDARADRERDHAV